MNVVARPSVCPADGYLGIGTISIPPVTCNPALELQELLEHFGRTACPAFSRAPWPAIDVSLSPLP
jgi:hypothetical protein